MLDSDAHHPKNIGVITEAEQMINRVNLPLERIINIDGKMPTYMRFNDFKNR